MDKVGIILLNFNASDLTELTIKSIIAAKTDISYDVCVVDNGSEKHQKEKCNTKIEALKKSAPQIVINYIDSPDNLGFSGGNNVAIKYFIEQGEVTHICLLNSDVIVTDYWLDYMMKYKKAVIGPVTNAAGNEQTVQIDYEVDKEESAFEIVNEFAKKRHLQYNGYMVKTDIVTFFATVIRMDVVEKIGLLDERFYPGSFEDDDYCLRIIDAGFEICIARDCFLHHFGSGSFSKLDNSKRKQISDVNKQRFEEKWGVTWKDRTWKLLESCKQDVDFLINKGSDQWAKNLLDQSIKNVEEIMQDWSEAIMYFTSLQAQKSENASSYALTTILKLLIAKLKEIALRYYTKTKNNIVSSMKVKKRREELNKNMNRIFKEIQEAQNKGQSTVCVFAPMFNKENEKDGYIQRIKAVDKTVLDEALKIYLYDEGVSSATPRFDFIDKKHLYMVFNSHDKEQRDAVIECVKQCGVTYTHSILRFMEDRSNSKLKEIFDLENVVHFWDVHGAVPEEYILSDFEPGAILASGIESYMAERVDYIVCVSAAMGNYLKKKYPKIGAEMVTMPIFNENLLVPVEREQKKEKEKWVVTYAGGTQPWQNIALMQDIIAEKGNEFIFRMFVPSPDEFMSLWGNRKGPGNMSVESKTPEDLYEAYKGCHYGFVLRNDSPVNYVACPTKIIEYMKFGLVPILKSIEIGDFVSMGMLYLDYQDFIEGRMPDDEQYKEMQAANYEILKELSNKYIDGKMILRSKIKECKR